MNIVKRIAIGFVTLIIVVVVARNVIVKTVVVRGVKAATGVDVRVGGLDIGVAGTRIGVKDLRVLNPAGFEDRVMISVPEVYFDYELISFLKRQPHIQEMRLHVQELTVIKNAQGQVNVNALRPVREQRGQKAPAPTRREAAPPALQIDVLQVRVDRVVYKDYALSGPDQVKTVDINLNERFEGIHSAEALVSAVLMRSLARTAFAQVAGVDMAALKSSAAQGILGAAGGVLDSAIGQQGGSMLRGLLGGATGGRSERRQ